MGGSLIIKAATKAIALRQAKIIMGTGGYTSAMGAEKMVQTLAPRLQKPKAVPAKMAGKIVELAR